MNALMTVAADWTSNSRIRSPSRYNSRVMALGADGMRPGYAVSGDGLCAGAGRRERAVDLVPVVVTDGLEHEAHRVEPEGRVVGRWVLGEGARRLQHHAPDVQDPLMRRPNG